ncbi:phage tail sheath subtilisin-like domain-containing protein [Salipiger sp. H15]|uniref:Phage tail sheath subtilisin-like domain-containing protein n=1 Tax=Alloyangia sp. H15 TaxID=3029062 RepID=A0AAU8AMG7_9RHOB
MPVSVTYPGVYIQEIPSGSRAIAAAPTSVTAFVGYTSRGPVNAPRRIFNFGDFERQFGGLHADSDLSYSVDQYFQNGGGVAWIVRVANNAHPASVLIENGAGDVTLTATAASEGVWGNSLMLTVDYDTSDPLNTFNLTVVELGEQNGRLVPVNSETHRNLSMNDAAPTYAPDVVKAASTLITLEDAGLNIPDQGMSVSSVTLSDGDVAALTDQQSRIAISVDGSPMTEIRLFDGATSNFADVGAYVTALEGAINALDGVAVTVTDNAGVIAIESDTAGRNSSVVVRNAASANAAAVLGLGVANGGTEISGAANYRPMPNGTVGDRIEDFAADVAIAAGASMDIRLRDIEADGTVVATDLDTLTVTFADAPASFGAVRAVIQSALTGSANSAFSGATVAVVDNAFVVTPGRSDPGLVFSFSGGPAGQLNLADADIVSVNVARYRPGVGTDRAAQQPGTLGADGDVPTPADLQGSLAAKTGIFALEKVEIFNILVMPGVTDLAVQSRAVSYAEARRAMVIVDIDPNRDTLVEAEEWITQASLSGPLKSENAVAYFPRVRLPDPLRQGRLRSFPNSGMMAGLWARTDNDRGVWKAPAGIEAVLAGVQGLDYVMTDAENGVINPLGLNAIRSFPVFGTVAWGARTLRGSDQTASDGKYVNVRRMNLFLQQSLYQGTQFAVFEPNDEPLWAEIRLAIGSFMNTLFRQGAFQGASPREAYFVKCDASTTTQADIDLGIVNILVGFAPLKPAEFVIISIQQIAGQGA